MCIATSPTAAFILTHSCLPCNYLLIAHPTPLQCGAFGWRSTRNRMAFSTIPLPLLTCIYASGRHDHSPCPPFIASGFFGVVLSSVAPPTRVSTVSVCLGGSPGRLCCVCWVVVILSLCDQALSDYALCLGFESYRRRLSWTAGSVELRHRKGKD